MTWPFGLLALIALLWPDRIASPFDGAPLDRVPEAIIIGLLVPILWIRHPRFLATRAARGLIVTLIVWRAAASMLFVQDGWCVRFEPSRPYVKDGTGAPHAWDLRADWRAADPACSAIMTRSYRTYREFPAWFFNLPPPNESWPLPEDLPPAAVTGLTVRGFVSTTQAGVLGIETGPGMSTALAVDGHVAASPVTLDPGIHQVVISGTMTGKQWRLVPSWNARDLWSAVTATVNRPSKGTLRARQLAWWVPLGVTAVFVGGWLVSAVKAARTVAVLTWAAALSAIVAWLVTFDRLPQARWALLGLLAAPAVPVPPRLRNQRGAFLTVGVPWLAFVAAYTVHDVGLWGLYAFGNDYWMYQRYGYRIVMQGFWLEGGSPTFHFQPLYRWISGLLHVVFGDSSAGEFLWDGGCLLAGAMLAFRLTRAFAGFRWALVAAAAPLLLFEWSSARDLLGVGLSEISSTGLMSMAALVAIRSRRSTGAAIGAGIFATLAFYTRLNNLLMAFGVAVFALSLRVAVRALIGQVSWWRSVSWRTLLIPPAIVGIGVLLFAWRTWYYTGVFSIFYGTQRYSLAIWQPGMPLRTVAYGMAYSVSQVLTVNDPPRLDFFSIPVIFGAIVPVLSVLGVPRFRNVPAAPVLFFFAAMAGSFIARGFAYPGRFSVHVLPITSALAVCGIASLSRRFHRTAAWVRLKPDTTDVGQRSG
jgi:hypothetical protein